MIRPEIEKKKHERKIPEDEDIIIKSGQLKIYFKNYYSILSLSNDLLIGGLYFFGGLASILGAAQWITKWSYLAGGFFLIMRPVLKILRNIYIYKDDKAKNPSNENEGSN